ncbi:hypothetical protein [Fervidobacterium sp. 2310opik-2]|uniref:hypothetical protein n=1 Tax=Fervidobacterium sp. 2310opik-2 TaxID=1755815 RepID=UPI0013DF0E30|nr:hypothetical protein [Fervidobacterium sp. 2310opik-2]KAF2961700.1 hypothetical protein AS161_08095 [Fervidobacterium sp. 2310opik-2]HOJ94597.1 hypothetical protein [Fervidobacterium nodosum]
MILIIFMILRIFAIGLLFYTLFVMLRFLTSPESPTEVGRKRELYKDYKVKTDLPNEKIIKAFKVFGLTPQDSYSTASYRYFQMRRMVQNSSLPGQIKEGRIRELDELFDALTDYYRQSNKI